MKKQLPGYGDDSRWFDELGKCGCGKAATGIVRGKQNQPMGVFCKACAARKIKRAEAARGPARPPLTSAQS